MRPRLEPTYHLGPSKRSHNCASIPRSVRFLYRRSVGLLAASFLHAPWVGHGPRSACVGSAKILVVGPRPRPRVRQTPARRAGGARREQCGHGAPLLASGRPARCSSGIIQRSVGEQPAFSARYPNNPRSPSPRRRSGRAAATFTARSRPGSTAPRCRGARAPRAHQLSSKCTAITAVHCHIHARRRHARVAPGRRFAGGHASAACARIVVVISRSRWRGRRREYVITRGGWGLDGSATHVRGSQLFTRDAQLLRCSVVVARSLRARHTRLVVAVPRGR